jgi:phosphocarrier protein HPr
MQQKEVVVRNPLGLHARVAARLAQTASKFKSSIVLVANGRRANARSLIALMILAAGMGARVSIEVQGPDELDAIEAVAQIVERGFAQRP